MKNLIIIINKYVANNDLFDEIHFMGGEDKHYCVIMDYGISMWGLIDTVNRFTGHSANVILNKKTNQAVITYNQ